MRFGGCQRGAVRFRVDGELGRATICHCRMCQKAFAAPYAALVTVGIDQLAWTRGAPSRFQSSDQVARGFCGACGTPLTFEWSEEKIDLAVLAFDQPAEIPIVAQLRVGQALPWALHAGDLAAPDEAAAAARDTRIVARQHPDHDTADWPPRS